MSLSPSEVQVWLDADFVGDPICVGTLHHERGQLRFSYQKDWLRNPAAFALDPDLTLDKAPFFPRPDKIGCADIYIRAAMCSACVTGSDK